MPTRVSPATRRARTARRRHLNCTSGTGGCPNSRLDTRAAGISPVMARRTGYRAAQAEQPRRAPSPLGILARLGDQCARRGVDCRPRASPSQPVGLHRRESWDRRGRLRRRVQERDSREAAAGVGDPLGDRRARPARQRGSEELERTLRARGWTFPLVFKPDVGQRGTGVRWVRRRGRGGSLSGARAAARARADPASRPRRSGRVLRASSGRVARAALLGHRQAVPGPWSAMGRSTLEALILVASARSATGGRSSWHATRRGSIACRRAGEVVPLVRAGNHAQGTQFFDGQHLATPALEARVDEIAQGLRRLLLRPLRRAVRRSSASSWPGAASRSWS